MSTNPRRFGRATYCATRDRIVSLLARATLQTQNGRLCVFWHRAGRRFEDGSDLECELHRELNLTRDVLNARDQPKVWIPQAIVWPSKHNGVRNVEKVAAELKVGTLPNGENSRQRDVQILEVRSP